MPTPEQHVVATSQPRWDLFEHVFNVMLCVFERSPLAISLWEAAYLSARLMLLLHGNDSAKAKAAGTKALQYLADLEEELCRDPMLNELWGTDAVRAFLWWWLYRRINPDQPAPSSPRVVFRRLWPGQWTEIRLIDGTFYRPVAIPRDERSRLEPYLVQLERELAGERGRRRGRPKLENDPQHPWRYLADQAAQMRRQEPRLTLRQVAARFDVPERRLNGWIKRLRAETES